MPVMTWRIHRQDDNGNVFEVARYDSEEAALVGVDRFEAHTHKQMYWVEEDVPLSVRFSASSGTRRSGSWARTCRSCRP